MQLISAQQIEAVLDWEGVLQALQDAHLGRRPLGDSYLIGDADYGLFSRGVILPGRSPSDAQAVRRKEPTVNAGSKVWRAPCSPRSVYVTGGREAEQCARNALRTMTDHEGLSVREAADWCGSGVTVREVTWTSCRLIAERRIRFE